MKGIKDVHRPSLQLYPNWYHPQGSTGAQDKSLVACVVVNNTEHSCEEDSGWVVLPGPFILRPYVLGFSSHTGITFTGKYEADAVCVDSLCVCISLLSVVIIISMNSD